MDGHARTARALSPVLQTSPRYQLGRANLPIQNQTINPNLTSSRPASLNRNNSWRSDLTTQGQLQQPTSYARVVGTSSPRQNLVPGLGNASQGVAIAATDRARSSSLTPQNRSPITTIGTGVNAIGPQQSQVTAAGLRTVPSGSYYVPSSAYSPRLSSPSTVANVRQCRPPMVGTRRIIESPSTTSTARGQGSAHIVSSSTPTLDYRSVDSELNTSSSAKVLQRFIPPVNSPALQSREINGFPVPNRDQVVSSFPWTTEVANFEKSPLVAGERIGVASPVLNDWAISSSNAMAPITLFTQDSDLIQPELPDPRGGVDIACKPERGQTRESAHPLSPVKVINPIIPTVASTISPTLQPGGDHSRFRLGAPNGYPIQTSNEVASSLRCSSEIKMFSTPSNVEDELTSASSAVFDDAAMKETLRYAVYTRFKECLVTGAKTSEEDMQAIADAIFTWARGLGAVSFAHWFFPMRGGGGATGGVCSAFKMDTLIDLEWSSEEASKPFQATLPYERLFFGETDGSSFPNGGLRETHTAAAFTTWDRSSPCFVMDKVLRIPCSFVTHLGACIDDKTPLLRSNDAVNNEGLRLLKAIKIGTDATAIHSFLGWEQEFFVVPAEHYRKRPDLVNCGRTLIGRLPTRSQQMDLNYFAAIPDKVQKLLFNIQAKMLKLGVPMAVIHNEVAPAQHEMSPIYCQATFSSDNNVLFMEIAHKEAIKLGLAALFHEKPFAGINGSGKHNNWSIGTNTGLNFFYPGKTDDARKLFVTGIACLAHGLKQHNELVRCAVAHAGNDHRLGAQEAPPAIISLYPGTGFEQHVDNIIMGGPLLGYKAEKKLAKPNAKAAMDAPCGVEDRNRTAPFPFCGNRFEFRAVGSSQNCSFPIAIVNTVMASGMAALASMIEHGMSHRDAVAEMFKMNRSVIFTGNGYSAEWPIEAAKRGLPNLNTTPAAIATFNSKKAKQVFTGMGIFSEEECDARQAVMYENYNTVLRIEASTLISMVDTGILPACEEDIKAYAAMPILAGDRRSVYVGVNTEIAKLKRMLAATPHELTREAEHLCYIVKPQMAKVREFVDKAEGLLRKDLYPFPTYEQLIYSHHS